MRSSLFIRLHTDKQISWAIFDPAGQLIESATDVSLDTVPRNRPPLVLIPGTDVVLTEADIPTKQWQRIVQAVPYALEEQFADDIENLHFALEKPRSGNIAVVVIARSQMEGYLQQLDAAGLTPAILTPDILAVPKSADGWSILCLDEIVLVRTGLYSGFAIELDCLNVALQIALTELETNPPQQITVFSGTQSNSALIELEALGLPITEHIDEKGIFAWLAQGLVEHKPLNLLQGDYRPQDKMISLLRPWRLTTLLLVLWGGLIMAKQGVEYQQMTQQRQTLNAQIEKVYRETFPEARKVVNPRVQMEQKLKALRAQKFHKKKGDNFLSILNKISSPLTRTPGFKLKRIEYRQAHFDLVLEVANLQALDYLKKRLSRLSLTVEIQSAISQNNFVETRLRIQSY